MTAQQLPEDWQMVKFGDIANHISKRVEPSETELDIYVGLEHLDPNSLQIKRHGVPSDVAGQKLLVKKGQIIFGKRRAYQRKVAVADWDCICSAHAMVLEAVADKITPEFLPFFMQSEEFMARAVSISEGSLSPTIKWKALERQEFSLPTKEQQARILSVLNKIDSCLVQAEDALEKASDLYNAFGRQQLSNASCYIRLDEVCLKIQDGTHFSPKKISSSGDYQYVTSKNIRMGKMEFIEKEFISSDEHIKIYSRCNTLYGDILLTKDGASTGNVCLNEIDKEISLLSSVAFIRTNPDSADRDFIYHWLMSNQMQAEITSQMSGNAITRLTLKKIKSFKVPALPLEEQRRIGLILQQTQKSIFSLEHSIEKLRKLKQSIFTRKIYT